MNRFKLQNFISTFRLPFFEARLALYDPTNNNSETTIISERNLSTMLTTLTTKTHRLHCKCGGTLPSSTIKEVVDNLVHSDFADPLITVFADGSGVRIADQGPGIANKELAILPGYTSVTSKQRRYIRGMGQGLALASFYLKKIGGQLEISDNLHKGTVVTLWANSSACVADSLHNEQAPEEGSDPSLGERLTNHAFQAEIFASLTDRQQAILTVLSSQGPLGPSRLAEYINTSPSSAYRDMVALTELGLLIQVDGGKRMLNPQFKVGQKRV